VLELQPSESAARGLAAASSRDAAALAAYFSEDPDPAEAGLVSGLAHADHGACCSERAVAEMRPDTAPERVVLQTVAPEWPAAAPSFRSAVLVLGAVEADGSVRVLHTLLDPTTELGWGFQAAAIEAVEQWRLETAPGGDESGESFIGLFFEFTPPEH
jgi:hypothetical protein